MALAPISLEGRFVKLRPLAPRHVNALVAAAGDGKLWTLDVTVVPTAEGMSGYVNAALEARTMGRDFPFVVEDRVRGHIVGTTRYRAMELEHRRLEIGSTWLAASAQRTPVNTESKYLLLRHAFEVLACNRVEFLTDALNGQSRAAIARLGAREEGVLRSHMVMPSGRVRDSVCYSIIRDEWPGVKAGLEVKLSHYAVQTNRG